MAAGRVRWFRWLLAHCALGLSLTGATAAPPRVIVSGKPVVQREAVVGETVRLDVAATAAAAAPAGTTRWRQVVAAAMPRGTRFVRASLSHAEQAVASFVPTQPGFYVFEVTGSDGAAATVLATVGVAVVGGIANAELAEGDGARVPGWQIATSRGGANVAWQADGGRGNPGCLCLSAEQPGDATVSQELQLAPYTAYAVHAWVKAEGLRGGGDRPAALVLWGREEGPAARQTTFDWTPVTVHACTNQAGTLRLGCRLGSPEAPAAGRVWFDQFTVEPDPTVQTFEGQHFILHMPQSLLALTTPAAVRQMVGKVDAVCVSMAELTGNTAEASVKQSAEYTGPGHGGFGGVSGNPLSWGGYEQAVRTNWTSATYCAEIFLHELGHNFTWSGEWDAEFAMYYALEQNNLSIAEDGYSRGAGTRHRWQARMRHAGDRNGTLYKAILIRDRIGWEPFRRFYEYCHTHPEVHALGETWARFKLQHDLLKEYSGVDVWSLYTPQELQLVKDTWPGAEGAVERPEPVAVAADQATVSLGQTRWQTAKVGWEAPLVNAYLGGTTLYRNSLWAHANSEYRFRLGGKWRRLAGSYGLEAGCRGSVQFVVLGDGRELARSTVVHAGAPGPFSVDLTGVQVLTLVTNDGGDGGTDDHGIWFSPVLSR